MPDLALLTRPSDGVALVTMDLSEIGGFVSWAGVGALADALEQARTGGARVSVLASAFDGHWLEHAWLPDLWSMAEGQPTTGDAADWQRALHELAGTSVVTIAAVSGDCSGGGAELGWACDLRLAEEQARFGQPEVMLGLTTGIGGTSRLARLIGRTVTAEMVLDGAPMTARRIYELGGVNRVVASGTAVDEAVAWAARLAERPPIALATAKQILIDNDDLLLAEALASEQRLFATTAVSRPGREGMRAAQARFDDGESIRDVYGPPRS
jgi:enoyl-CoA hydratase/carnithine racemase